MRSQIRGGGAARKSVDDGAAPTAVLATDEHTSPLLAQGKDPRNRSSVNDELYLVG